MMQLWISLLVFCSVALIAFVMLRALGAQSSANAELLSDNRAALSTELTTVGQLLRDRRLSRNRTIDRQLRSWPVAKRIQRLISQAGLKVMTDIWLVVCTGSALTAIALVISLRLPILVSMLIGVAGFAVPLFYLLYRKGQRCRLIEAQLPDALDSIARAMQAGNSFSGALAVVGRDALDPLGGELRLVSEEINFGSSTREGLLAMADRLDSMDIRYFVVAVLIHSQTGGNLTELLKSLSALIRDRQRLRKLGQALSAEGRLSAWILILMPFVTAALLHFINPEFMSLLWKHPVGLLAVQLTLVFMLIGSAWMWRIVHFKV